MVLEALLGHYPYPESKSKSFLALYTAICQEKPPAPPDGTPDAIVAFMSGGLQVDPRARASVADLLESEWLRPVRLKDTRRQVFQWLVTAAAANTNAEVAEAVRVKQQAKKWALRALATSAEGLEEGIGVAESGKQSRQCDEAEQNLN